MLQYEIRSRIEDPTSKMDSYFFFFFDIGRLVPISEYGFYFFVPDSNIFEKNMDLLWPSKRIFFFIIINENSCTKSLSLLY